MRKPRRRLSPEQEAANRGLPTPEGVDGVWMDMRFKVNIECGVDLLIDQYSDKTLHFGSERFFYLLSSVQGLPDNDVNKTELQRYVERIRAAFEANNTDALEGWLNALAVAVKSVRLFIPKTAGKVRQEAHARGALHNEGTRANSLSAKARKQELVQHILDYIALDPDNKIREKPSICRKYLMAKGWHCDYAATYLDKLIATEYRAHRRRDGN